MTARAPDASPARTMLVYRSLKYWGWVPRLSARERPPFKTRRTSRTMKRKLACSVSSAVMLRARSRGTVALSRVESSWGKKRTSRRPVPKAGSVPPEGGGRGGGGCEQGGNFLGEEEDVAASFAEGGECDLEGGFSGGHADVDGGEALFAELAGDELLIVAGEAAGADLTIAGHGAEEESGGHQAASGERVVEREGVDSTQRRRERRDKRREHKNTGLVFSALSLRLCVEVFIF